ncbi:O-antigen ligase family protein [Bacillus toyonensis]|uniref:O-antigen ligase family protein n=1 Tax=Bacillus toyonensis TaxID=155322 RepID=UPI00211D5E6C|nr:O-antigen ligase family protein [Bacillus toyonensis]
MIKSRYLINYFIILLIVLSGNVFFSLKYPKETRIILIVSTLLVLLYTIISKNFKFSKIGLSKLLIFKFLITLNFLFNTQNGISLNDLLFILILMFSVFILKEKIELNTFKISYVSIMKWICITSLVCYFLSEFLPINQFPFYKEDLLGTDVFRYSFYHSWGWGIGTERNPGMFWEPGAFQCYINLAILFLIFDGDNNFPKKKNYYFIFICTLITTQSTTGYIIAGLIFLYASITLKIKVKKGLIKIFLIAFSIIGVMYFINTDVVSDKFNRDNSSYSVRTNDLEQSLDMIKESPILGVGYLSDKQYVEQKNRNIEKNSNGLLIFIIQFGIAVFIIYLLLLYKGIKEFFTVKFMDAMFILLIFMIMFSSEPIVLYPIWIYFLF